MIEQELPIPNPEDWTDAGGAAEHLGVARSTVYDMVKSGVLTRHVIGGLGAYWVPELRALFAARERVGRRAR